MSFDRQSGFAHSTGPLHSPRLRSAATRVDASARGDGAALKITVCERHAPRAGARGFYFPTVTASAVTAH